MNTEHSYGLRQFEDARWTSGPQQPVWRHSVAAKLVRREPVLDIGGGDGLLLQLLARQGMRQSTLIDISPVAVARARETGFRALEHDFTDQLPFSDREFACATLLEVLEHFYDPVSLLREAARVADDIVVVVPNFHYWRDRVQMISGRVPFQSRPRRGHVHWFNDQLLAEVIDAAGLRVDAQIVGGFTRLGPIGPWLAKVRPRLFATTFAVRLIENT